MSSRRPHELVLDAREHRFFGVAGYGSRRSLGQTPPKLVVAEESSDRGGERGGIPRRHEEAVDAVANHFRNATHFGRDHWASDRKRFDDRVREVLPRRREDGCIGRAEQSEDLLARHAPHKAHPSLERELSCSIFECPTVGAVTGDDQRDVGYCGDGLERESQRLLRREPACEREDVSAEHEIGSQGIARRKCGQLGSWIRQHRHTRRVEPPPERDVSEVRAGTEDVPRAPQSRVARRSQESRARTADMLELIEGADVPAASCRAFEDLVGDELGHERRARKPSAQRRPPDHARGVDDVSTSRTPADEERGAEMADARSP